MKKMTALCLLFVCLFCMFGCASTQQDNGIQEQNVEQGNILEDKESLSPGTTIATNTTEEQAENLGEIPGAVVHVVDIWDQTKREQLICASALEKFWEDEANEYYFACIKSHYVLVMDSTGRIVDVKTALAEGLITIEMLNSYCIGYIAKPKNIVGAAAPTGTPGKS